MCILLFYCPAEPTSERNIQEHTLWEDFLGKSLHYSSNVISEELGNQYGLVPYNWSLTWGSRMLHSNMLIGPKEDTNSPIWSLKNSKHQISFMFSPFLFSVFLTLKYSYHTDFLPILPKLALWTRILFLLSILTGKKYFNWYKET